MLYKNLILRQVKNQQIKFFNNKTWVIYHNKMPGICIGGMSEVRKTTF